ncbi:TPA: hypothetical protein QB307_000842 [Pasteurella multocida]|uniref:DNA binding protein n=1 Tax=Pasteurella multocida TaxID=747 RepID=A0A2Z4PZZ2_PASMD|nr:Mor transcription activator family protein [Pasteurella multocida]AWY03363.1 DNA binding protein [Pasteurella multocida]KUM14052.1 hypothetical protein ASV60_09165 [Pasteurella multocida]HDR1038462.1 hypothetical protein [Pasteurella multocida]HDR1128970.1 hypothetical protein [Pasteurella multocida]HDR1227686.1 hypothetical protein [Pasteurella multocida]
METYSRDYAFSEFIESIAIAIKESLGQGGTHEEITQNIINKIYLHNGGMVIYIPKGNSTNINSRNRLIRQEFTGDNHAFLAKKYGLSLQMIYNILRKKTK